MIKKFAIAIAALFFGLTVASISSANACQGSYGYQSYDNGYGY